MAVHRESLESFLLSGRREGGTGSDEADDVTRRRSRVEHAMAVLEPLFRIAESGLWSLASVHSVDRAELVQAVCAAFGDGQRFKFDGAELVALSQASPQGHVPDTSRRLSVSALLYFRYSKELEAEVYRSVDDRLRVTLLDSLQRSRLADGSCLSDRGNALWSTLSDLLFFYVGLTYAEQMAAVERLEPLVRLLPDVIPVGISTNRFGALTFLGE